MREYKGKLGRSEAAVASGGLVVQAVVFVAGVVASAVEVLEGSASAALVVSDGGAEAVTAGEAVKHRREECLSE